MNNRRFVFSAVLAGVLFLPLAAHSQYHSSVTFENGAGQPAIVKLIGPAARTVSVPQNRSPRQSGIALGGDYILVGLGDREGYCSYMLGDPSSQSYRFSPGFLRFSLDSGGPCIPEPQRREP